MDRSLRNRATASVQLGRKGVAPLLKSVTRKAAARDKATVVIDVVDDEDVERSPESSEDDYDGFAGIEEDWKSQEEAKKLEAAKNPIAKGAARKGKRKAAQSNGASATKQAQANGTGATRKRLRSSDPVNVVDLVEDSPKRIKTIHSSPAFGPPAWASQSQPDRELFPSYSQPTRGATYGRSSSNKNIHARSPQSKYGMFGKQDDDPDRSQRSKKGQPIPKKLEFIMPDEVERPVRPQNKFIEPKPISNVRNAVKERFRTPPDNDSSELPPPSAQPLRALSDSPLLSPPPESNTCPSCKQPVDAQLLRDFRSNPAYGRFKNRLAFCLDHRRKTALEKWDADGYPQIGWEIFDKRLRKQDGLVQDVLNGRKKSHFRNEIDVKIGPARNKGKIRLIHRTNDDTVPGYYGPKGAASITEHIMQKFGSKLQQLSLKDDLIGALGVGMYIQHVLVMEVATRLVMEDRVGYSAERARALLRETAEMGELVNKEDDENIEGESSGDDDNADDMIMASP